MKAKSGRKPHTRPLQRGPMRELLEEHLAWLVARNYSRLTVSTRRQQLVWFIRWAIDRSLDHPAQITRAMLESYQRHLFHKIGEGGRPLSFPQQHARLVAVRAWFRWLVRQGYVQANPASEPELPRLPQRLPKSVLTESEAEAVLGQASGVDAVSLRDRAILETLYATGMRRMEATNLTIYDIDRERGTVAIRQGKGKKDRIVPIGQRALDWIGRYLKEARPEMAPSPDDGRLFITHLGEAFTPDGLSKRMADYVDAAKLTKRGACHLFRHTCATLMLEGGADLRYIQQMLGHADVSTTQIYTQVSVRALRQAYELSHPAAKKKKQ